MTFVVEAGGRARAVEFTGRAGAYRAVVDGRAFVIDAGRAGGSWSLLVHPADAPQASRSHDVTVAGAAAGDLAVSVDGRAMTVRVAPAQGGARRRRRDQTAVAHPGGPQHVTSPMPGRLVKVLVRVGETVSARQPLVVVEAMKMENELRAPRAGTVTDVRVNEGAPVDAGAVLIVIA